MNLSLMQLSNKSKTRFGCMMALFGSACDVMRQFKSFCSNGASFTFSISFTAHQVCFAVWEDGSSSNLPFPNYRKPFYHSYVRLECYLLGVGSGGGGIGVECLLPDRLELQSRVWIPVFRKCFSASAPPLSSLSAETLSLDIGLFFLSLSLSISFLSCVAC